MQNVTKTEWHDWKQHPVTREFFKSVSNAREELLESLASFQFVDSEAKQNQVIGLVGALTKIIQADYEE
jgi:hypothetical protein